MLVAVGGSQGSGKSTILTALNDKGYNVIGRKTSRSILSDWNVTLQEVNSSKPLAKEFQEEILARKIIDDLTDSNSIIFTERTPIDLAVYTVMTFGNDNNYSDWIDDYINRCVALSQQYDHIFYIPSGQFKIEQDGTRGINKYYSKVVDYSMKQLYQENVEPSKFTQIGVTPVSERINTIITVMNDLSNEKENN